MKKRSHVDTSRTISRILAFIFSAVVAYFLWSYLRPRFVSPVVDQTVEQSIHDEQSEPVEINEEITQQPGIKSEVLTDTKIETAPKSALTIEENQTKTTSSTVTESQSTLTKSRSPQLATKKDVAATTQKAVKNLPANRTITVHNGIEKKMLGYKKFGTHYPTAFKITVGNTVVQQGDNVTTAVKNNICMVRYDFEFMNGYRRGAREVTVELKPNTDAITLAFNWKQKYHLVIAEADKVTSMIEKDVPYQA